MSEQYTPPQPATIEDPVTLPEGATYQDLNVAHEQDQQDGGSRLEELHPTAQAQKDAANVYRDEMSKVTTPDLAEKLRSRFTPDQDHDNKSEFEVRTGENNQLQTSLEKRLDAREGNFEEQDNRTESMKNIVQKQLDTVDQVKYYLQNDVADAEEAGRIRPEQALELAETAKTVTETLQRYKTDVMKNIIQNQLDTVDQVKYYMQNDVADAEEAGRIRPEQALELAETAKTVTETLQRYKTDVMKNIIQNQLDTVDQVKYYMQNDVADAEEAGRIRPEQALELAETAKTVTETLQRYKTDVMKNIIQNQLDTVDQVKYYMQNDVADAEEAGRIRPEQALELAETAKTVTETLQRQKTDAMKNAILNHLDTVDQVNYYMQNDVANALIVGKINPDGAEEIYTASRDKIAEINDGVV